MYLSAITVPITLDNPQTNAIFFKTTLKLLSGSSVEYPVFLEIHVILL